MNAYQVLGIDHGASPEEIRQAYRRQASRWHPDRNPHDPEASVRFREARAAYNELTKEPESAFEDFSFGNIFENLFRHAAAQNINLDMEFILNLRLTQAALGGPIDITLPTGQRVNFNLPERLTEGHVLKIQGHGHQHQGRRGDLIFKVHIQMPKNWTAKQKEWLKKIDEISTGKGSIKTARKKSKNSSSGN